MTPNETDRRRRRLLVRSLVRGRPDFPSAADSDFADNDAPLPLAPSPVVPDDRGEAAASEPAAGSAYLPRRMPPAAPAAPQPTVMGPVRVIESQLDAVLRMLGAAPTPPPVSAPPAALESPAIPPAAPPLMLPPFQSLPTRRPVPTSRLRSSISVTVAPHPAAQTPPPLPSVQPAAPAATTPPVETKAEIAATVVPEVAAAPDLAERSAALRSRSKIGVMKQDAAALSARLKELARLLETDSGAPSDEALCAWDDCRRLALMLHHELDRGLPQPEGQRTGRTAALPR